MPTQAPGPALEVRRRVLRVYVCPPVRSDATAFVSAAAASDGCSRRDMKIAGRWRDHERWAILAEDCRARRPRR